MHQLNLEPRHRLLCAMSRSVALAIRPVIDGNGTSRVSSACNASILEEHFLIACQPTSVPALLGTLWWATSVRNVLARGLQGCSHTGPAGGMQS